MLKLEIESETNEMYSECEVQCFSKDDAPSKNVFLTRASPQIFIHLSRVLLRKHAKTLRYNNKKEQNKRARTRLL